LDWSEPPLSEKLKKKHFSLFLLKLLSELSGSQVVAFGARALHHTKELEAQILIVFH
jgi:hypothetical protein